MEISRFRWSPVIENMVRCLVLVVVALVFLTGCAGLKDARFVTKDGKESPYKYVPDRHEVPSDPTARY